MSDEQKELCEWLATEHCPKCGINEMPADYSYVHCAECTKKDAAT